MKIIAPADVGCCDSGGGGAGGGGYGGVHGVCDGGRGDKGGHGGVHDSHGCYTDERHGVQPIIVLTSQLETM